MEKSPFQTPKIAELEEAHQKEREPFKYALLKGHFEPDNETWKSDQELRMQYLQLTDELIHKMVEGTTVNNPTTGEKEIHKPSVVIFLDKSARPLSHLVREAWPLFARDGTTGEVPPMPDFKFLNIDREQWINKFDQYGNGMMDINEIDPSIIRGLHSIFLTPEGKGQVVEDGLSETVDSMPTILDNKSLLIVDETYSTGRTVKIASELLGRAIPSAHIDATHWMHTSFTTKDGTKRNGVPVWYKDNDILGRGIGNRYADSTRNRNLNEISTENYYRTIGRWFLSSPLQEGPDELYLQLIQEFKELVAHPDVPIIPSYTRNEHDWEDRLLAYNYRDIDTSRLTTEEREPLITAVIERKQAIHAASKQESERVRVRPPKRPRRK